MVSFMKCELCPRRCGADRETRLGMCNSPAEITIARAALHMWEEPPISGERGSGTVFFSGCPLSCVYCQNISISRGRVGRRISRERLTEIMLELEGKGAHNINFVTPTHYVPHIIPAVAAARDKGLSLPIVYNTSGYERAETIDALCGTVDVYLTDFRYATPALAEKYSGARDYPEVALRATERMVKTAGDPVFDEDGMMQSGVIVRQLILPGYTEEAMRITDLLYSNFGDGIYVSLMNQYTPTESLDREKYPELARALTQEEYDAVVDHAIEIGVTQGFIQDGETAKESFIPDFDLEGV